MSGFSNQAHAPIPTPPTLVVVEPPALRLTGVVYRATSAAGPWMEMFRFPGIDVPMEDGRAFFRMGIEWGYIARADGE